MRDVETNARTEALGGGATLEFVVPASASEVSPERLPKFEVSGLPGARVALRRGFVDLEGANVHVACVEAPSDRWAPGMEDVVFGIANGVAHLHLGLILEGRVDQEYYADVLREWEVCELLGGYKKNERLPGK